MASPQTGAGDPKLSLELLWRVDDERDIRPGPKRSLSVDAIVDAAIRVADREGSGFSMRSVSAELGAGTMTIYRYVPGKRELIDLMVDRLSRFDESADTTNPTDTSGPEWRGHLDLLAEGTWQLYVDHPWVLDLNQRRPVLGPDSLAGFDWALGAFDDHALPDKEINLIINAIINLVTGTARQYLIADSSDESPSVPEDEWWSAQEPYLFRAIESGRYPRIARITDEHAWDIAGHESMRYALDAFLDGLSDRIDSAPPRTS